MEKIHVGDLVQIKSWDEMKEQFGLTPNGHIDCNLCFIKEMKYLCGKPFIVESINNGLCLEIDGYYISTDMVKKIDPRVAYDKQTTVSKPNNVKIVITKYDNVTRATKYIGDKRDVTACARCHPEDEYDFETGAKLAFNRLAEKIAEKKEKAKPEKVFSLAAYIRAQADEWKDAAYSLELGWPQILEGKTEKEIEAIGYTTSERWMVDPSELRQVLRMREVFAPKKMKKVFSREKYLKNGGDELAIWPHWCEGKTEEEMKAEDYVTGDEWMIEVEDK